MVMVLPLVGLTNKRFGQYADLKIFPLDQQDFQQLQRFGRRQQGRRRCIHLDQKRVRKRQSISNASNPETLYAGKKNNLKNGESQGPLFYETCTWSCDIHVGMAIIRSFGECRVFSRSLLTSQCYWLRCTCFAGSHQWGSY